MSNILGMDGKPKQPDGPTYNMRLCLIGQEDIDIKNIQTFGIAEDGFFMVKSYNNLKLPVFMTNPMRVKSVEIFKEGDKPVTKLTGADEDDDLIIDLLRKSNATQSKDKKI